MALDYRELTVWQRAMELVEHVYRLSSDFPREERYGLAAQVRRAAVSVPSCIAEGNARASVPDYLRFLSMASGSLAELDTQFQLAGRLGYSGEVELAQLGKDVREVMRLLHGLRRGLENRVADAPTVPCSLFPVP